MKALITIAIMMTAVSATAQERTLKPTDANAFRTLDATAMNPSTIYYNEQVLKFEDWKGAEKELLVLYPGYEEPKVVSAKDGQRKEKLEKLTAYVTRQKTVLNKAAAQINLASLINLGAVSSLDTEIRHIQIQPSQFMGNLAGKGAINNFQWCNKSGEIVRPAREIDLSHTQSSRPWCNQGDRSICVESCYLFNPGWSNGVAMANMAVGEDEKKDLGVAFQAELRYLVSEAELGGKTPLSAITQIKTPVRGIVELNMFYVNQIIQYGKVVAVVQEHPTDASKSVITSFVVLALKSRTYNKYAIVRDVLMGKSPMLNSETGLTAGIPKFSQNFAKQMIKVLEQ